MNIYTHSPNPKAEPRCAISPDTAKRLKSLGLEVILAPGTGLSSGYTDQAFSDAGAELKKLSEPADFLVSVERPTAEDIAAMKPGSWFAGTLDPFNRKDLLEAFAKAKVNAIAMEMIPRTTLAQKMDVLSSQANIAGYEAVIQAAAKLRTVLPMMMTPAGTLSPAKVFIIGVGVAGLQAIATAKRLGARVEAFDTRPVVEEQVKSLGAKFVKIDLGEMGQTDQGYAKALTPEQIEIQRQAQAKICAQSDIVITTAKLFGRPAPKLILPDVVAGMKPVSVIVDLAAETGGNVAWTEDEEALKSKAEVVVTENDVTILRAAKFENFKANHSSQMYSANIYNLIEHFWDKEANTIKYDPEEEIMKGCLMTYGGKIVNERFKS